jgi:hypothetical protein
MTNWQSRVQSTELIIATAHSNNPWPYHHLVPDHQKVLSTRLGNLEASGVFDLGQIWPAKPTKTTFACLISIQLGPGSRNFFYIF